MGTLKDLRKAGFAALAAAALLTVSLVLVGGGPPSQHPNAVLAWFAANSAEAQLGAVTWMLAMLALVVFAISFREALWAATADRSWMTVLFLQGASVFATVAVVSAALGWALAHQAAAGAITADVAGTLWALELALLRFATWGFTVPLAVAGMVMFRHSLLGQLCALAAVLVALGLVVPLTWAVALHVVPAWLALAGVTLTVRVAQRVPVPATTS